MAMNPAQCLLCGDPVRHNPKAVGRMSEQHGRPLSGWYHSDSNRRDHEAAPHDFRSPADESIRHAGAMNRARVEVNRHLGAQFALLDAEKIINDAGDK